MGLMTLLAVGLAAYVLGRGLGRTAKDVAYIATSLVQSFRKGVDKFFFRNPFGPTEAWESAEGITEAGEPIEGITESVDVRRLLEIEIVLALSQGNQEGAKLLQALLEESGGFRKGEH